MISQRSKSFSATGLGLVLALVLTSSSCLGHRSGHHRTVAVKAEADADRAHAQADAVRAQTFEPEYFEGDVAPEVPAALSEVRSSQPSPTHVWVAGHHTRRDGQWAWVRGRWVVPPSGGAVWVPGHWVSHLHGFMWINGAWR